MEITAFVRLVRRWLWLIILCAVVAGSLSYIAARTQPVYYVATTTLQVGGYMSLSNPGGDQMMIAEQLAQTYSQIVKTYPVLSAVIKNLNLPFSTDGLAGTFRTGLITNTSLMTISVTYQDPIAAADIANELATQLIADSPTQPTDIQKSQLATLQDEMGKAKAQLQSSRDELSVINDSLTRGVTGQDQAILTARKAELVNEINSAESNLTAMSGQILELQTQTATNQLRVVEQARVPDSPIGASSEARTLITAAIGALAAVAVAFLIEYLNDSIRSPSEIMPLLNVPVIGTIAPFGQKRSYKGKLIAWTQPRSTISEAYRALRVNLMYRENNEDSQRDCRIYVVTSSSPSEGKSITVANLAVTFAITGMRVLVIDTDLRRPSQHQIFELPNTVGLSNIWANADLTKTEPMLRPASASSPKDNGVMERSIQLFLSHLIQKTAIPGLDVITSGPVPANPAELLDTIQMRELISQVANSGRYDAIFFDTPPTLVVSDSGVTATISKGQVILIVESGRTKRASALRTMQQLAALSLNVAGVVVNRLNPRDLELGYGEYYYSYSYSYYGEKGVKSAPVGLPVVPPTLQSVTPPSDQESKVDRA